MIIKNVTVFGEDLQFTSHDIYIENGRFVNHSSDTSQVIDGEGCYAIPALVDIHFHGCMGDDFCDGTPEAIEHIAAYEASIGVGAIAPATMTLPEPTLVRIMKSAAQYTQQPKHAALMGINMEGPFISPEKKGAQAADFIIPCDVTLFHRLQQHANGLIKLVDIAPEEPGAMEFIQAVKDEVVVSLAHTAANYDTAKLAYDTGAKHATHLYNAMLPFTHRAPGVIGAAHDSKQCMVELICDGIHIHPSVVRTTFDMFGPERIVMISDSMCATGMPNGRYSLGGQDVDVIGNRATLTSDGALAGSATNLMDCLRVAVMQMGIPLEYAVACTTINPAKVIGIEKDYGSIAIGKIANVVLLDKELNTKRIIINEG